MDALKIVPQVFYDLISRIVPGGVALVSTILALGLSLGSVLDHVLGRAPALHDSTFVSLLLLITLCYFLGQVLAPLSIFLERKSLAKLVPSGFACLERSLIPETSGFSPGVRAFLASEVALGDQNGAAPVKRIQYYTTTLIWFDWVRMNCPDAGARLAKIRAEYRMHGQIALALTIACLIHILAVVLNYTGFNWVLLTTLLVFLSLSLWGEVRMSQIFQWSVIHHYYVVRAMGGTGGTAMADAASAQDVG